MRKKTTFLYKNIASLLVVQFANYVAPFLVIPYLSRMLGLDGFGNAVILLSLCGVLAIIVDFGFNISATPTVASHIYDRKKINDLISTIFTIKVFLALFLCISFYSLQGYLTNIEHTIQLNIFIFLVLLGQAMQSIWLFQGLEKMKFITYISIYSKIIYVVMVFILVRGDMDINNVVLSLGISNLIGGTVSLILVYRNGYSLHATSLPKIREQLCNSFSFFLSRASISAYSQASVLIIGTYSGSVQAGLYGGCEKLYQGAQSLMSPVISALYPHLVRNKDSQLFYKLMVTTTVCLVLGCSLCIYLSEWIITLVLGPEFVIANNVFLIFMCIVPLSYLSMNFGYPAFALIDKVNIANLTVIIGSICHISGLCLMGWFGHISAYNVASLLLFTECIILILRISLFLKYKRHKYE